MDVNSKINWKAGMELTANLFRGMDESALLRRVLAARSASSSAWGVLSGTEFSAEGMFSSGKFEFARVACTALLPSGNMLCIDEPMSVPVGMLPAGEHYLCIILDDKAPVEFEKDGVQYVRPSYAGRIVDAASMEDADAFPVKKFVVEGGMCTLDASFLPPCMRIDSIEGYALLRSKLTSALQTACSHANMPSGDGKATLLRCLFRLNAMSDKAAMADFTDLCGEIAGAAAYFIFGQVGHSDRPSPRLKGFDQAAYLNAVTALLEEGVHLLDATPLVDNSIDYEALKAEIQAAVCEKLTPVLTDSVIEKIRPLLDSDIDDRLSALLKDYIDGTFGRRLSDSLKDELTQALRQPLYDALYKSLYDALFVPEPVVDNTFVPHI